MVGFVVQAVLVVVAGGRTFILDVAALAADLVDGFPPAGGVGGAVGGVVEVVANVTAAVGVVVPLALLVVAASSVGRVAVGAAVHALASSTHGVPLAHAVEQAVGFVGHGGAGTRAHVQVGVPRAVGVGVAASFGLVAELAVELACLGILVDFAGSELQAVVLELLVGGVVAALDTDAVTDAS